MKKLVLAAGAIAMMAAAVSCGKSSSESAQDKAFDDSLTAAWGYMAGGQAAQMVAANPESLPDRDAFLRGMQTALSIDTADASYLQGLAMGVRMAQQRTYAMKELGVNISPEVWMKQFKKAFLCDTVPDDTREAAIQFQMLAQRAETRMQERKDAELEKAPEAVANTAAGEAFIDSLRKADPAVKVTESGLAYKIDNPGEGDSIRYNDRVYLTYTGRFADGKEFDSSKDKIADFTPSGVVPGFGEGLQLLRKGGKATFYIPGKLGYGVHGQPMAGIGPNQMLVFDVEIISVNDAPEAKK